MSYDACIAAIKDASKGTVTDDDIEQIVNKIRRRRQMAGANPMADERALLDQIAKEIANEERVAALVEKRSRAINVLRKQQRFDFYSKLPNDEAKAISILNVGSERRGENFGKSVAAQQRAIEGKLVGPMLAEMRAAGLEGALAKRTPEFDADVARNMWAITEAEANKTSPRLTGLKQAQDAARIITKYQEMARLMQNDAGAWIGKVPGYVVRQSHDMFRVRKAGFEKWRDTILPKLDPKTFEGVEDINKYLNRVYTGLSTGEHWKERGADDWLGGFKGPGNLAKRASQERSLHFKSADDWFAYNEQFGSSSLLEAVLFGLRKAADNTGLMRRWGTNPEAAFKADLEQLRQKAANRGDPQMVDKLKGWLIKAEFDQITGAANIPGNPSLAKVASVTRALISMAKLPFATLSSFSDAAAKAATLKHQGIGFLEGYGNSLQDVLRGKGNTEQRVIADHLGVGYDGLIGAIKGRFSATDTLPGSIAKLQNRFFRWNLLNWWTDGKATGAGLIMSHNLARNTDKAFADLHPKLQESLTRYGIGKEQWEVLRQADTRMAGEVEHLTPDMVQMLPDNVVSKLTKDQTPKGLQRAKDDLEIALRSFYSEEVMTAITQGGAKERAIATWGTTPGTAAGEAVRFFMQFKLFSTTFATRHIAREWQRGTIPGAVHLIVATMALGYLSMIAKDLAKGKVPRDPSDFRTWLAAAQQGGGLGIYGDFLFGDYSRFGSGPLETLAGPAVGTAGELLRAFSDTKAGISDLLQGKKSRHFHSVASELTRFGANNVPLVNQFYTKAALDYLIFFQISETMNPGYLHRMERKMQQDNGQRFIIPPSSTIPYGGGNRLFEGVR